MTKHKSYRHGKSHGKAYLKEAGHGFEVGFYFDTKAVFVGNFIHAREANLWYGLMNRELRQFSRKYAVGTRYPAAWYAHFVRNHLYKCYYGFLDRLFARYNREYVQAFARDERKYKKLRRDWDRAELKPFFKAA